MSLDKYIKYNYNKNLNSITLSFVTLDIFNIISSGIIQKSIPVIKDTINYILIDYVKI